MPTEFPYATHLNVLFNPLEKIALNPLVDSVTDRGTTRRSRGSTTQSFDSA